MKLVTRSVGSAWVLAGAAALFGAGWTVDSIAATARRVPAVVQACAPCHGVDGTGGDVEKPNLAGQKSIYLRQQLLAFRSGKRRHPDMQYIGRELTEREIDQLVVYYSTLPPL